MSAAAPLIFAPLNRKLRLTARGRLVAGLIAVACLFVLWAAAYLEPDPSGIGTTTRLGMRPCAFPQNFNGLPCAACGMTTSFNHFARGEIGKSLWVQPMGTALAIATCVTFWGAIYIAATGRPAHRLFKRLPGVKLVILAVGLGILAWAWKIGLTLAGAAGTSG